MRCRRWAVTILLSILVSASLLGPAVAVPSTENLGIVRTYNLGDLEAKASDLEANEEMGYALLTRGDEGVLAWDLATGRASQIVIPSLAWAVTVEIANDWLMVTDVTGRLHGINEDLNRVGWSKHILEGNLRVTAVSEDGSNMAFLGIDDDLNLAIEMITLRDLTKWPSWSEDIPDELAMSTPTCAAWLPTGVVTGWNTATLLIGTSDGLIFAWRGSGLSTTVYNLAEELVGMQYDPKMGKLVAVTGQGRVYVIDVEDQEVEVQFTTEFTHPRKLVAFDYLDGRMVVGGSDGQIEVWNMEEAHRTQIIRHHNYTLADAALINSTHMVSAGRFAQVVLWGPDIDGDLHADEVDAFPTDKSEWRDKDLDGVGDSRDMFPNDPKETWDTDGDGVGDNGDVFPKDPTEWADADGDGSGDNGDFLPNTHNMFALGLFIVAVALAASLPMVRMALVSRKGRRNRREAVKAWLTELDVSPPPEYTSPNGKDRLDRAFGAYNVREMADPPRLVETVEAYDTTVLNTIVALRVQEEITQRGGVGADAAMSRAVHLRDNLQELDGERERLDAICKSYWQVQDDVDAEMMALWPHLKGVDVSMKAHQDRVQMLDNTLEHFRKSSIIKIGDGASKISRGAYVVAAKEVRFKGAERPLGVKVGVPPKPEILVPEVDEKGEATPLSITPPMGRLRTRMAILTRDDTAELVVTVDNTLAEDLEELAIDLSIAGDRLRHKGPHKIELGTLVTGRSAGANFKMRVVPPPPSDEEPAELTRVLARVTGMSGSRKVRQELPAKATNLVTSTLVRPSVLNLGTGGKITVGRRGVKFPRVPSNTILSALEFPHGMLPLMDGTMDGGGTWRIFVSTTDADEPVMVLVAVDTRAESVDLFVEVRGPPRFPSRELAEEVIDSVRFAILSDRRLRLRGEDKPLSTERTSGLAEAIAKAYIGHPDAELVVDHANGGQA
jgi:hypothetical protein